MNQAIVTSRATKEFFFEATVWLYSGKGAWHFITLPKEIADEITYLYADLKLGWGSLPVEVKLGETTWKTSIFTDKKSGSYLLPLKATIRQQESIMVGQLRKFHLRVML